MSTTQKRQTLAALELGRPTRGRWIMRLLRLTAMSVVSSVFLFWLFYNQTLDAMLGGDLPLYFAPEEMEALSRQLPGVQETMLIWGSILVVVNTALTIAVALYINAKISGPMVRIKNDLERIANGDLTTEIELRDDDDFQDVAEIINSMVTRLQIMLLAVRESASTVARVSATVQSQADRETLERCSQNVISELSYFETIELPTP